MKVHNLFLVVGKERVWLGTFAEHFAALQGLERDRVLRDFATTPGDYSILETNLVY